MLERFPTVRSVLLTLSAFGATAPAQDPIRPVGDAAPAPPPIDLTASFGVHRDGPGRVQACGGRYRARFDARGVRFEPALGAVAETVQHLGLAATAVLRGGEVVVAPGASPTLVEHQVQYRHAPGVVERYDVRAEGLALSWRFDAPPAAAGDLVVRYAVDTSLPAPAPNEHGGLSFVAPGWGGVSIGGVTGVDANGDTVAGDVRFVGGALELSLPAGFVDGASYPLVLDPLIGSIANVGSANDIDGQPDVAYDATVDLFGVAFTRTFASNDVQVYLQRISVGGNHTALLTAMSSGGVASHLRIADLPQYDRFGIVYKHASGFNTSIRFAAASAGGGLITHATTVVSSTGGSTLYEYPDIAGDAGAGNGNGRGFVVVYDDNNFGKIRSHVISFDAQDNLVLGAQNNVYSDAGGIGSTYSEPAMSRMAAQDGLLLLAVRRYNGVGPTKSIRVVGLDATNGLPIGTPQSFSGTQAGDTTVPDVDGISGSWIVVWEETASAGGYPSVQRATVRVNPQTGGLTLGAPIGFGGVQLAQASAPTIAWTPGRAWLAYHYLGGFPTASDSVRARAIDAQTAADCSDQFVETVAAVDTRVVVATGTSGGAVGHEYAYCVFTENDNVHGQGLVNHGNGGTFTNLGGSCGAGGQQSYSHAPGIGSSGLRCRITNLQPSALLSVFNFATPTAPLSCGQCDWVPFSITRTMPVVGGQAAVEFAIPCQAALIGSTFVTQWTTLDLSFNACPTFPGLSVSSRMQMVIGN